MLVHRVARTRVKLQGVREASVDKFVVSHANRCNFPYSYASQEPTEASARRATPGKYDALRSAPRFVGHSIQRSAGSSSIFVVDCG